MVSLEFCDAATALAPSRHHHPTGLNRFTQNSMSTMLFAMAAPIPVLIFSMAGEVAVFTGVVALVFAATVTAPCLQTIKAPAPHAELHRRLPFIAFAARFHQRFASCSAMARMAC